MTERVLSTRVKGIAASPGLAIGRAMVYGRTRPRVHRNSIPNHDIERELRRWKDALEKAIEETKWLQSRVRQEAGENYAEIFLVHLLMLSDPLLTSEVERRIQEERVNAEYAMIEVTQRLKGNFQVLEDPYLKLVAMDIQDLEDRLFGHLVGFYLPPPVPTDPAILVAHEIRPSEVAQMDREKIMGLALDSGSRTSHAIILARSMNIPTVVGLGDISRRIENESLLVLDGDRGELILDPPPELVSEYKRKQEKEALFQLELEIIRGLPAITRDGKKIHLLANVSRSDEAACALESSAEGVGLLRSEFLFLGRGLFPPSEEEQFDAYRRVARIMEDRPTIIRTFDVGGDNPVLSTRGRREQNPFLGTRSLRLCFEQPDLFHAQLRAILRASLWGHLKIMFPMVATLHDLQAALGFLREAEQTLRQEDVPFREGIEVGIMLEVPSAALTLDLLIPEVDFLSIGTNDLFQYTLAIDRTNEKLANRYGNLDPAILRLIKMIAEVAQANGKPIAVCGEMAGELLAIPLLIGLGVDELSMSVSALLPAKRLIRQIAALEARELAEACLRERTTKGIERLASEFIERQHSS